MAENKRTHQIYKLLSLTYQVLTTKPKKSPGLNFCSTLSQHTFFMVTLARPPQEQGLIGNLLKNMRGKFVES